MRTALVIALALASCPIAGTRAAEEHKKAAPAPREQLEERRCFSAQETRERIKSEKLTDPFPIVQQKTKELRADVVSIKLCETSSGLVYEIDFLRPDGTLTRILFEARSGKKLIEG